MWQWFFLNFDSDGTHLVNMILGYDWDLLSHGILIFFSFLNLNLDRQGLVIALYKFTLVVRRGSTPLCAWRAYTPQEVYCIGRCTLPSSIINIEHSLVVQNHIPFVRDFAILNTLIDLLDRTTFTTFFKRNMPIQRGNETDVWRQCTTIPCAVCCTASHRRQQRGLSASRRYDTFTDAHG